MRKSDGPEGAGEGKGEQPVGSGDRRAVVQSVSRALDVLELLRESGRPLSAADIAKAAELERTIVYRLLRTLAQREMISESDGAYSLGPSAVLLGQRFLGNLPLRRVALPYMVDLQTKVLKDHPWTLALSMSINDLSAVIERMWTPATPLGLVLDLGDTQPLYRTAAGRAILAHRTEAEIHAMLDPDHQDLLPELDKIRAAGGVALVDGSETFGLQAIACVIRRDETAVAAIGIGGVDLGEELAYNSRLAMQIRHAAEAIGRMIP